MRLYKKAQHKVLPWKNGLGFTSEIVIYPPESLFAAGDFHFRISSAIVDKDCEFSQFSEYDRVLLVIQGEGLKLIHNPDQKIPTRVDLLPYIAHSFSGDVPTKCKLISGPVQDLNIFTKKREVVAFVRIMTLASSESFQFKPSEKWNYFFVGSGEICVTEKNSNQNFTAFKWDVLEFEPSSQKSEVRIGGCATESKIVWIEIGSPNLFDEPISFV